MKNNQIKILFISTSVGKLGSGLGGGVELTVLNIAKELQRRGHKIEVVAPVGSVLESIPVIERSHSRTNSSPVSWYDRSSHRESSPNIRLC